MHEKYIAFWFMDQICPCIALFPQIISNKKSKLLKLTQKKFKSKMYFGKFHDALRDQKVFQYEIISNSSQRCPAPANMCSVFSGNLKEYLTFNLALMYFDGIGSYNWHWNHSIGSRHMTVEHALLSNFPIF